ncbi:MAG: class I SAM-dependent methyltransferase [Nanopusillaceae archaeon]|jgi:tRNA (guanine37-N1)-methyltransferase
MSYDIIGDIAVIKKPLKYSEEEYVKKILEKYRFIKTILLQETDVLPPYRVPKYKILYGENKTETINIEYGLKFKVDVGRSYYSSRLANERYRIAKEVKEGEEVLVMFSGVNVYPIYISKFSKAKIIYSIELNPFAVKYGLENVKLNKVNNIVTILGDVRDISPYIGYLENGDGIIKNEEDYIKDVIESGIELNNIYVFEDKDIIRKIKYKNLKYIKDLENLEKFNKKFDRIIMPLPKESHTFLEYAIPLIKNNGIIHLYQFFKEEEIEENSYKLLDEYSKKLNFNYEILKILKVGDIAPGTYRVCIDFKVKF